MTFAYFGRSNRHPESISRDNRERNPNPFSQQEPVHCGAAITPADRLGKIIRFRNSDSDAQLPD